MNKIIGRHRLIYQAVENLLVAAIGLMLVTLYLVNTERPWVPHGILILVAFVFLVQSAFWLARNRVRITLRRRGLYFCAASLAIFYIISFAANYRANLPPLSPYIASASLKIPAQGRAATSGSNLIDYFRNRPPFPAGALKSFLAQPVSQFDPDAESFSAIERAKAAMASRYRFLKYPEVTLPHDLDWRENPFGDRSWNWWLHNMGQVSLLAHAYKNTGELSYLQRAEALVLHWIEKNSFYFFKPPSRFSWHDHGTAFRLMNWLYFWEIWSRSPRAKERPARQILRSLMAHGDRLASPSFYTHQHNHGIEQDRALLALALYFPETARASEWKALALSRLGEQITTTLSPNGVHLEHSPGYHFYVLHQLTDLQRLMKATKTTGAIANEIDQLLPRMRSVAIKFVKPDQKIAPVGDSPTRSFSYFRHLFETGEQRSSAFSDLLERDQATGEFLDTATAWPDAGYAIIRDFGDRKFDLAESLYFLFTSAAHVGRAHKQSDDLSFVLSYAGVDLLTDPGLFNYGYDDRRWYVKSAFGHNTVIVDQQNFSGFSGKMEKFEKAQELVLIVASHKNYPGLVHRRWVVFVRPRLFVMLDRITPDKGQAVSRRRFDLLFHTAPDVMLDIDQETGMTLFSAASSRSNMPVMRILQLGPKPDKQTIIVGRKTKPAQGWISPRHGTMVPAPVLQVTRNGKTGEFLSVLDIAPITASGETSPFLHSGFILSRDGQKRIIDWDAKSRRYRLVIDTASRSVKLSQIGGESGN